MAVNLVVNGVTFNYPQTGDASWGDQATQWATAITSGMLSRAGGAFFLTTDTDFGPTNGLKSLFFASRATNPASTGAFRLSHADSLAFRNNANTSDLSITVDASDKLNFNGGVLGTAFTVSDSTKVHLAYTSNVITASIITNSLTDSDVSTSAAIATSKLAPFINHNRVMVSDSSGLLTESSVTATTLGYLDATSSIQTQLNSKQATGNYITALTGHVAASGPGSASSTIQAGVITDSMINAAAAISHSKLAALSTGKALVTDGSGIVAASSVTSTELGYVSGVTSSIQSQFNALAADTNATANTVAKRDANGNLRNVNLLEGFTSVATAAGTTTLSASSTYATQFTGTTTQTVVLPNATTLSANPAYSFMIMNRSTGSVTVQNNAATVLQVLATNTQCVFTCTGIGSAAGTWDVAYSASLSSPLTTKGDFWVWGTSNTRHAVPNDGGYLIADSSQTDGWRNAAYSDTQGKPGKNYIQYADFENNSTTGWSLGTIGTLTNGLPTGTPTFGAGASGNLAISATNSSTLSGSYSLQYNSSAATTVGNMLASSSYPIDASDQGKVLAFKFNYKAITGAALSNFSGTSSNSYGVAVWDSTNSAWIPVVGAFSMVQSSGVGQASGTIQVPMTTLQLRFCVYNANATSGAAIVNFDDFYLGPQTFSSGAAMTDWVAYTPTGSWSTNTTYTGAWRRIGDSAQIKVRVNTSGAPTSATLTVNLPTGLVIDTTKMSGTVGTVDNIFGTGKTYNNASSVVNLTTTYSSTTAVTLAYGSTASDQIASVTQAAPFTYAAGCLAEVEFIVPIVGWSSNTAQSSDSDTRVVAMQVNQASPTATITGTFSLLKFTATPISDTHGAFSTSSGLYTCPVTGYYRATAGAAINGTYAINGALGLGFSKNTATPVKATYVDAGGSNGGLVITFADTILCNAGDTIGPYVSSTATSPVVAANSQTNFFNVERLSGPAVVQATESVNARYTTAAGQTITNVTPTAITYGTKSFDSHAAYSGTTYTIPVSGKYSVEAYVALVYASTSILTSYIAIYQNGSEVSRGGKLSYAASILRSGDSVGMKVSDKLSCLAGDTIQIYVYSDNGANRTLSSSAFENNFAIARVGN